MSDEETGAVGSEHMIETDAEVLGLLRSLLAEWRHDRPRNIVAASGKITYVPAIWGLTSHVHQLADDYLSLLDRGSRLTGSLLIRAAFECAMTAMWLSQVHDALPAWSNEDARQRRALAESIRASGWTADEDALSAIGRDNYEEMVTSSGTSARRFWQLCQDLEPGGEQAYVVYRSLSEDCHATMSVADRYVVADDSTSLGIRLLASARPEDPSLWHWTLCSAVVWSGRAFDFHDRGRQRRESLRKAARELSIPEFLKVSSTAWLRVNQRAAPGR
jgi:hypothetical protein